MSFLHYQIRKVPENTLGTTILQVGLITSTLVGSLLVSLGYVKYGICINFLAQGFWLYNTYKVWKDNRTQWGMFFLSLVMVMIVGIGVVNYFFLK